MLQLVVSMLTLSDSVQLHKNPCMAVDGWIWTRFEVELSNVYFLSADWNHNRINGSISNDFSICCLSQWKILKILNEHPFDRFAGLCQTAKHWTVQQHTVHRLNKDVRPKSGSQYLSKHLIVSHAWLKEPRVNELLCSKIQFGVSVSNINKYYSSRNTTLCGLAHTKHAFFWISKKTIELAEKKWKDSGSKG